MKLIFSTLLCITICWAPLQALAQPASKQNDAGLSLSLQQSIQQLPTMAGKPFEERDKIFELYRQAFRKTRPDVYFMTADTEGVLLGVVVYTDAKGNKPAELPAEVKALPSTLGGLPTHIDPLYILGPPSGVVVLRADGSREIVASCPSGYQELQHQTWRFCVDPMHPMPIPPMMSPPIPNTNISYEDARAIMQRHQQELIALPGVGSVGMGARGIRVEASDPSVLPKEVEGVPLEIVPYILNKGYRSHTTTAKPTAVRGAISINSDGTGNSSTIGVATGIAFSGGGMWVIFPSHMLGDYCGSFSSCQSPVLGDCVDRYAQQFPTLSIYSPPTFLPSQYNTNRIGRVVKWLPITSGTDNLDAAAAWLDNDKNQGNCSVTADQGIETAGNTTGVEDVIPQIGSLMSLISSRSIPGSIGGHRLTVKIDNEDATVPNIHSACNGFVVTGKHELMFHTVNPSDTTQLGPSIEQGDSGSPIINDLGMIAAMTQWSGGYQYAYGGGAQATPIKNALGFTKWYGTTTFPNNAQVCQ